MRQLIILLGFGVPAALALLAIGGDLSLSEPGELPRISPGDETPPPEPVVGRADSLVRQKILNWEYRHFDPQLGVFDWFARGTEAIPSGENDYEVKNPEVLFSSFTTTTPLLKKTLTKLNAGSGVIKFGQEQVFSFLRGGVVVSSIELFTPHGLTEMKLRTDEFNIRAANRRHGKEVPAAEFWSKSLVHVTGPSFELFGKGGMRGATQLNRMILAPPITMHLVTREEGVFFGKRTGRSGEERRVDVTGNGRLLVERVPEQNIFIMSVSDGTTVTDGDITVHSDKLVVAIGQSRRVERASAIGNIVVRQAGEAHLFGDEAKWDARSAMTVVTGKQGVRFVDGPNTLRAKKATLMADRKRLLLEGGVTAQLEGAVAQEKQGRGKHSLPRNWNISCNKAEVHLANEGGSMKPEQVLLYPAAGKKVLVRSADGAYEISGGSVVWDVLRKTVAIRQKPELARGDAEWVRSDSISVRLNDGVIVFEGKVVASFKAGQAAWKFHAGRMVASFEAQKDKSPVITGLVLTDTAGRVRIDYTGRKGARVALHSDRVSWDAKTQVALLDSQDEARLQKLEHGKDWMVARKITFEPEGKKALFEGTVRAHLEEVARKEGASEGWEKKAEPPFELMSEKLTLRFDDQYDAKSALAEGSVTFTGSSGGMMLECERARYVRGDSVVFEGEKRPQLVSGKNKLSAQKILVYLTHGRIVFMDKVRGGFDDGKGAAMTAGCSKMIALYDMPTGAMKEVYFEDAVHIEVEGEKEGKTTADGERAVYEVEKAQVSLTGKPVVVNQRAVVIREEQVVYDLKERVLFTKPHKKGYNWEIDPSNWGKKGRKK